MLTVTLILELIRWLGHDPGNEYIFWLGHRPGNEYIGRETNLVINMLAMTPTLE